MNWQHQETGVNDVIRLISEGERRICLTSPTGGGKARMLCMLIEWATAQQWHVVLYTNRKLLIDQLSRVLVARGIEHGVRASGRDDAHDLPVQVSSLPTENQRVLKRKVQQLHGKGMKTLILVDEAHLNKAGLAETILAMHYRDGGVIVGATATPIELAHLYDKLVVAGTTSELRACGALVAAYHWAPDEPDMKDFKQQIKTGEYTVGDTIKAIMTKCIFGRVWEWYERLNKERRPTILFGPGVAESMWFANQFHKAGVRAAHIDGGGYWIDGEYHATDKRQHILDAVKTGEIQVLCNRFVCLDDQTEILTDSGWTGIDAMTNAHKVANWDNGSVFFSQPLAVIRRQRQPGEKIVVLETPRRSIRVTENHRMLYRTTLDGMFLKCEAVDLVDRVVSIPVSGMAEPSSIRVEQPASPTGLARRITSNAHALRKAGFDPATSRAEAERRIKERESMRYKQPNELSNDECELIGFWTGDGNKNKLSSGGIEYRMWQGFDCPSIIARVDAILVSCGIHFLKKTLTTSTGTKYLQWSMPRGTGFGVQKRQGVFSLEPYLCKEGTNLLWGLNQSQFDSFLRGLWMANGMSHLDSTVLPEQRLMICSAKRCLFDIIQAVAVCRGYRASVRTYKQSNQEQGELHILSLTKESAHRLTKYRFQFEDGWKDERVWCVETHSGNIITRRKGSVTVMGNCREGLDIPEISHVILATIMGSLQSYLQSVGRGLRACAGKDRLTIQDHGGHYHRHGSVNMDREWNLAWTEAMISAKRLDAFRGTPKAPEPISCMECGMVRARGSRCPGCGHESTRQARRVIQQDGRIVEQMGDIYKPRKVSLRENTQVLWTKVYFRANRSKNGMTFRQAEALFYYENHYWPPKDLKMMPKSSEDWFCRVKNVPKERLIG